MYKKAWYTCKLVVCLLNLLLFCRSCCRRRHCCFTSLVSPSRAAASTLVQVSLPKQRLPTLMPQELGQRELSIVLNLHKPLFIISKKWLVVVKRFYQFFNISNVKVYIHRTYTRIISLICIIKRIRRSTQGSSVRIDRFGFGLTLNSSKLEKNSKHLR